jgi:4-hydroxybenzoate polyprenyltransferase
VAIAYPFAKRVLAMPQAVLGVAFSFGIPMAFAAALGGVEWHLRSVPRSAWALLLANLFWVLAYDTEYAMVDRDDDLKIGVRSSAIALGRWDVAGHHGLLRHPPGPVDGAEPAPGPGPLVPAGHRRSAQGCGTTR